MGQWETPRQLQSKLASRADRREFTNVQLGMRTCRYCKGVFTLPRHSGECEAWHRGIFRRMRSDLSTAIDRLHGQIQSGARTDKEAVREVSRLAEKLRQVPKD